jgi:hypothetical protein
VKLTDKEIADAYAVAANQNLRPQDKVMVFAVSRAIEDAVLAKLADRQETIAKAIEKRLIFTHNYGEESYGLVYINQLGKFEIWIVPLYGGMEHHYSTVDCLLNSIEISKSFT